MTDQEIIKGLIEKDENITKEFFFKRCKPLFYSIIRNVFDYQVEYDELINELYLYLMENDAARIKSFQFRSSVYQWMKMLSIRFFIRLKSHGMVIDNESHEPPYEERNQTTNYVYYDNNEIDDLRRLIDTMPNKRYAFVLKRLFYDDTPPETVAREMGIEVSNLYNIKQRAIRQLTEVALKDIHYYGKL